KLRELRPTGIHAAYLLRQMAESTVVPAKYGNVRTPMEQRLGRPLPDQPVADHDRPVPRVNGRAYSAVVPYLSEHQSAVIER
ncbi:MAG: hypothetical protein K0R28_7224, partial [Paenibacillus sp.]|nr:hypothetical protein [Paenibacillus sp.]